MKTAKLIACGALAAASAAVAAKPLASLNNLVNTIPCGGTKTATNDSAWTISGRVFVGAPGCSQELAIQEGTFVKGLPGDSTFASVLVITRFGRIKAIGTPAAPIVFTSVLDNEDDLTDMGPHDRAKWGGVILLGSAPTSEDSLTTFIEGIPVDSLGRSRYGGTNPTDSSGVMKYVSIRHGGKLLGNGNEINGLTMGGVGSKTVIDYVEAFAANDDGFEWFGGTVNAKHLISAFGNDDLFDYDFGYRGKLQFGFGVYSNGNVDDGSAGNQGIEGDGHAFPLFAGTDTLKYSKPKWSNLTLLGSGNPATPGYGYTNDLAFRLRDGTGGDFRNLIVKDWRLNAGRFELQSPAIPCDAPCKIARGDLSFTHSWFWNLGNQGGGWPAMMVNGTGNAYMSANNTIQDPQLYSVPSGAAWKRDQLDPRPKSSSPALFAKELPFSDASFDSVGYAGAFSPDSANWMDGWSAVSQQGILKKYIRWFPTSGHNDATASNPAVFQGINQSDWGIMIASSATVVPTLSKVKIENVVGGASFDFTGTFDAFVWGAPSTMIGGERYYRVAATGFTQAYLLNTYTGLGAGLKKLSMKLVMNDGSIYWDSFYINAI